MKITLLGGGGFISSAVQGRLLADGHRLTILKRHPPASSQGVRYVAGERHDPGTLAALAAGRPDAVVDFLCYEAGHARELLEAFAGCIQRLVMISTGSVYWCTGAWQNPVGENQYDREDTLRIPPTPLTPGSIEYDYGTGKRAAEDVLARAHARGDFTVVRLRFPVVGGPGDPTGRYAGYVQRVAAGGPLLLPDGGFNSFRHLYVEDAAAAVAAAVTTPGAGGGYNVASSEMISVRDLVHQVAGCLGRPEPEVVSPPRAWLLERGYGDLFAPFSATRDQVLAIGRARRELAFQPTPYAQWLAHVVAAGQGHSSQPREELEAVALFRRTSGGALAYLDAEEV
ncbi:MAG: NAD-dependent epimerase/dehydratase family protein [Acidobacteria bacterium]|nr:MAG: NAD-dependent epimerase/dehydratase family protein [Acidobacteriota bacterium]